MTVPFPFILKQWSMRYKNLFSAFLYGRSISSNKIDLRVWLNYCSLCLVEKGTILTFYPNLVFPNTFLRAEIFVSTTFLSSMRSTLLRTTIIFFVYSSAIMMHYAVWAWIPLVKSMTKNIISMICAPPIIVRIKEACPGQSTKVNWRYSSLTLKRVGVREKKAEKPKSRVIPLSCDCGFLSRLAVEVT